MVLLFDFFTIIIICAGVRGGGYYLGGLRMQSEKECR